jgi:hypothetical protein
LGSAVCRSVFPEELLRTPPTIEKSVQTNLPDRNGEARAFIADVKADSAHDVGRNVIPDVVHRMMAAA